MKEKIIKICNEICCDEILEDTPLITSGILDSFKVMQLIAELESEFQMKLSTDEITNLENFFSVNRIMKLVYRKTTESNQV